MYGATRKAGVSLVTDQSPHHFRLEILQLDLAQAGHYVRIRDVGVILERPLLDRALDVPKPAREVGFKRLVVALENQSLVPVRERLDQLLVGFLPRLAVYGLRFLPVDVSMV